MSTYSQTAEQAIAARKWVLLDASGATLGRLATQISVLIRGKHKPQFTKHVDGGDYVVVVNASKIKLTGNKLSDKLYRKHTEFVGHVKEVTAGRLLETHPERLIESAVQGMLPKGPLGRAMLSKLKVYPTETHPHTAQNPEKVALFPLAAPSLFGTTPGPGSALSAEPKTLKN